MTVVLYFQFLCSQLWTVCEAVPGDGHWLAVPAAVLAALSSVGVLPYSNECFVGTSFSVHLYSESATGYNAVTSSLLLLPNIRTSQYSGMGWGNVFNEYSHLLSSFLLSVMTVVFNSLWRHFISDTYINRAIGRGHVVCLQPSQMWGYYNSAAEDSSILRCDTVSDK